MFKNLFRRKPALAFPPLEASPNAVSHTLVPSRGIPTLVKTGKWVIHLPTGQVGILTSVAEFPKIGVMLVNEVGEDYRFEQCDLTAIRIARRGEIPENRRPTPEAGAALGYF